MPASLLKVLQRLYFEAFRSFIFNHRKDFLVIISIVALGVLISALAPLAIAQLISSISGAGQERSEPSYYIMAFILLKFMGQATVDLRWRVINPLLYSATYYYCQIIVSRITATYIVHNGFAESASQVSERTAILSKMQIGSMSVLHGLLVVIFPAILEIIIVMAVVYAFIGPAFIGYFLIAGVILFIATGIGRAREIHLGRTSYDADNEVLMYCGEILANSKLNREMQAEPFLKGRLGDFINASMKQYTALFKQKYRRASYLTLSTSSAYVFVFAWAAWLIHVGSIAGSELFLLVIYLERVLAPITGTSAAINNVQHGLISIGAGYDLLDGLQQKAKQDAFMANQADWQRVQLSENVIFKHSLDTLHVGIGKHIRFTGHSGAGKSTCLRRIYRKLLDIHGIEAHRVHFLSAQAEWVQGSLFENIALGSPEIDRTTVGDALDHWSRTFGNRKLTLEQPMHDLSAGERQWIAILRSLLREPQVLFMDEATNSLDVHTEPLVWRYLLDNITTKTTLFIVTHQAVCPIPIDHDEVIARWISTNAPHPQAAS